MDALIVGLLALVNSPYKFIGLTNQVETGGLSMQEVTEKVQEINGSKAKHIYLSLPEDGPKKNGNPIFDLPT